MAPPERVHACLAAVREHLLTPAGALLLAPAYETPDETIGYITRYAPGLRENGGVYTHAATWAIAAAAKARDAEPVSQLLAGIDPTTKDSDRYWAEPYVLPGNVDGPPPPPRPRRLDLIHRRRRLAAAGHRRVGAGRAADLGRAAPSTPPAAGLAANAGEEAVARSHPQCDNRALGDC